MNHRPRRLVVPCAAFCALTVSSCYNEGPIDYPQSTPTFSTATAIPLGSSSDPKSKILESRSQQLIPATHLPTSLAYLTSVSFHGRSTGRVQYAKLRITLSHSSATKLDPVFAKNLPNPAVVFDSTDFQKDWTAGKWTVFHARNGFSYDGKSGLVIDIQKVAKPLASGEITAATCGDPGRPDLPTWRYTTGGAGSGAWKSTNALAARPSPVQVRIWFALEGGISLTLRSDRIATGSRDVSAIGGTVQFTLHHVGAGFPLPYALLVGTRFRSPVRIPGIGGMLVVDPLVVLPGSHVAGPTTFALPIPKDKSLVGQAFRFQVVLWTWLGYWTFSNGVDAIVRSDV